MTRMFTFDPHEYAARFADQDYVYIPQGLSEEFYQLMCQQVDAYYDAHRLKDYARGDKQQALYEFPSGDYQQQFLDMLAALSGLESDRLVISERHIKGYEANAAPKPMPHKDRYATQLSVGFTVRAPEGSTLILYPQAERSVNQFSSWIDMKASLSEEQLPTTLLKDAPRVEIQDKPRDIIMFRGNEIWHGREHGANTVMLYFKLNAFHSDPLGEDPRTEFFRQQSQQLADWSDEQLLEAIPILGRRVDYIHRRYTCHWQELLGVVLYGESHFTIDEQELHLLRASDGQRTLKMVLRCVAAPALQPALLNKVRRLARRGVLDLLPPVVAGPEQTRAEDGHANGHATGKSTPVLTH
jgi:hypothetical protein